MSEHLDRDRPPESGGQPTYPYQRPYGGDYEWANRNGSPYGQGSSPPAEGENPSPYQYSPGNGWQQPREQQRYQWDFAEYDRAAPPKKRKKKKRGWVVFSISLLCVLSVGLLGLTGFRIVSSLRDKEAEQPGMVETAPETLPEGETPGETGDLSVQINNKPSVLEALPTPGERMTIPQVAKAVRPSVVGVVNYQGYQFLEPYTEGSGIVMTQDGYIVTNAHVVEGAEAIMVVFDDDQESEAELIGADARTDLAVLKVNRNDLIPAIFGNSEELEVGETVIAIGNPGGIELAGSVTRGIVSAVNRIIQTPTFTSVYIQTDAAINPGNSGGALCNEFGQVIGINCAKIVAEGYEGISFAIPITEAVPILEDLITHGRVTGRVLLGITGNPVSNINARHNVPAGVQILSISSEEMIEKGVLRGDIITHIGGERVLDLNDIRSILGRHKAGDVVTLTLFRQARVNGLSNTFDVEITLMEDTGQ